jgi:hypothetical protein
VNRHNEAKPVHHGRESEHGGPCCGARSFALEELSQADAATANFPCPAGHLLV